MIRQSTFRLAVCICFAALFGAPIADGQSPDDSYNVRDYGATGDGTTDDSAAIQNAINAAAAAGGGKVYVPAGTYLINSKLNITGGYISFVGSGAASMIMAGPNLPAGGRGYMLEAVSPSHDIEVGHLFFRGRGAGASDPAGVHAGAGTYRMQVQNCRFYNLGYYGGVDFSSSYFGFIHDNFAFNCSKGISVSGTSPDSSIVVTSNVIHDCNVGIAVEFGRDIVIANNSIEYTKTPWVTGIQVIGTDDVIIAHNTLFAPKTFGNGITLGPESSAYGNSERAKIAGNSVTGFAYGIRVQTMTDGIIDGNSIKGSSAYGIALERSATTNNPSLRNIVANNIVDVLASATGIAEAAGGGDKNIFEHNRIINTSKPVIVDGLNSRARENSGYLTETNGTATIPKNSTSVLVPHGLSRPPALKDISVTPTNSLGNAAKFWISNVGVSNFQINVDTDPGSETATFAWAIVEK